MKQRKATRRSFLDTALKGGALAGTTPTVPTAGSALSSPAIHQRAASSSRTSRPPGPPTATSSPSLTCCAHSDAGPAPCSTTWISSVLVAGS